MSWPAFWVDAKAPLQQLFDFFWGGFGVGYPVVLELFEGVLHLSAFIEGSGKQALVHDDANCPDFGFFVIDAVLIWLRGHVGWWANIVLQLGFIEAFNLAIPEIDNFRLVLMQHDIGRFQVPMHDSVLQQAAIPSQYPPNNIKRSTFT